MKRGRKPVDETLKAKRISASIYPQAYNEDQHILISHTVLLF